MLAPVDWHRALEESADAWGRVAIANVRREVPAYVMFVSADAGERHSARELHPAFYGSFDWHSCVEMHWALVGLLRLVPELDAAPDIRAVLDEHLEAEALAAEVAFLS